MLTQVSHLESDHGTWRDLSHVEVLVSPAAGVERVHHHSLILGALMEATVAYTLQPENRNGQCKMCSTAITRYYETAVHTRNKNISLLINTTEITNTSSCKHFNICSLINSNVHIFSLQVNSQGQTQNVPYSDVPEMFIVISTKAH